jgi:hypothetical protein
MDFKTAMEKNPSKTKRLVELEERAKLSEITLDLKNHKGIEELEKELFIMVRTINTKLVSNNPMTELEREKLLVDRERCMWFINIFPNAKKTLENINNYINKIC